MTLKGDNKEVIFSIIASPCDILSGAWEEMELFPHYST